MKVRELYYPFYGFNDTPDEETAQCRSAMRTVSGISFDPVTGHLLVVEPNPDTRTGHGIYELIPDSWHVKLINLPELGPCDPYGIAVEAKAGCFWISDVQAQCLLRVDRIGRILSRIETNRLGIFQRGIFVICHDGASLIIGERCSNTVNRISTSGERLSRFDLTPFPGAELRGITSDSNTGNLLLAYASDTPEIEGHVGEYCILEVSLKGTVLNRIDTVDLGFCALDITLSPDSNTLFAVSREFVLPRITGDHCHVFEVDLDSASDPDADAPNSQIVRFFLKHNTRLTTVSEKRNERVYQRWEQMPVPVIIEGLIDMTVQEVRRVFLEWSECTKGSLVFDLVEETPETGIIFTQGDIAVTVGRPGGHGIVTVCVCDLAHLSSHPHWMNAKTVQRNIARHEVGHAIGFAGHSPRFRIDAMNSISGYSEKISPEEAMFTQVLYSDFPHL